MSPARTTVARPARTKAADGKAQLAYDWLAEQIRRHRFGPGHRLVLSQLAEQLDISVVPVREALRRLQAEGLVTYERNIGATVAMPDEGEYAAVMEAVAIMEAAAAGLAAPLLSQRQIDEARDINERMKQLSASVDTFDPEQFTALNGEFHRVIFEASPNPFLKAMVERAWSRLSALRESTFSFIPSRASSSTLEHDQILQLLTDRAEPAEVERAVRAHRMATLDAYLRRSRTA